MTTSLTNPRNRRTIDFQVKYKTEKCRYWCEKGFCPYSSSCAFAHFDEQIREKMHLSGNYRTKACINFITKGFCLYGLRCQYKHEASPVCSCDRRTTRSNSADSSASQSSRQSYGGKRVRAEQRIRILEEFGYSVFNGVCRQEQSRLMRALKREPEFECEYVLRGKKDKKYSL